MSQVLYPSKPIPRSSPTATTSAPTPLPAASLATPGTIASSSRPKRAAAIASQAATLASTNSGRRKSSQSSNKSVSHPSQKTTTTTPLQGPETPGQTQQQQQASGHRLMAALPRSKRPRRGDPEDSVAGASYKVNTVNGRGGGGGNVSGNGNGVASKSSIMMGINSTLSNGFATHSTADSSLQSSYNDSLHLPTSASSSTHKITNGNSGSVREVINGQEREVFVVDSASPASSNPHQYDYEYQSRGRADSSLMAKGKRKAVASPATAANHAAPIASTTMAKRRKKDGNGAEVVPIAAVPAYNTSNKGRLAQVPPQYGYPSNPGQYRSGYETDRTYQSPNGTRWNDSTDPYHPAGWNAPVDDSEGHYIIREGNLVAGRYAIKSLLGQGTFGKVVRCKDTLRDREVAIKIIRSIQKYTDAAQIEIRVLKALRDNDPGNDNKCIHLIDTFTYRNHVCIVSELLGQSVFDFLKDNEFHPFPCKDIWSFAKQLLRSVAFLHRLGLVHTDLKPENILLVSNEHTVVPLTKRANSRKKRALKDSEIRLIDFGSATFNDEYHSQVVSTRHYRAPEIILQMGWSFPCDAWSIGCILIEFYTGEALFQTHDNLEHLAMMEAVLGVMPDDFRRKAETYRPAYFRNGRLDFPTSATNKQSRKFVKGMQTIDEVINTGATYTKHDQRLRHLLKRLLTFDPSHRIRVDQALKHPYFDLTESEIP